MVAGPLSMAQDRGQDRQTELADRKEVWLSGKITRPWGRGRKNFGSARREPSNGSLAANE
jgi:hypothetical protein